MAIALSYFRDHKEKLEGVKKAREDFEKNIKENFPNVVIFGEKANRLPGTTLLAYPGLHGQAIQIELESHDIFVTTSSACSDNDPTPSKVIKAMEFPDDIGRGVVRVSFGLDNSEKYYPVVLKGLCAAYEKLTKVGSFAKS